ncbi:MAG: NUDIX domain-containing protein [Bacteroidota bacterium]
MKRFNVRVYGVLVEQGVLLVTDEIRFGIKMTKLPGGGVKFGEGLEAALKREWMEELGQEITVGEVIYINPFLQVSAFNEDDEVLCVYFSVSISHPLKVPMTAKRFDFPTPENDQQIFRKISLIDLEPEDFTFPIDQSLVPVLRQLLRQGRL